jgi:hypothetical protein
MENNGAITFAEHHACELHATRHAIARVIKLRAKVVADDGLSLPCTGVITRVGETSESLQKYFEFEKRFFLLFSGKFGVPNISRFVLFASKAA